MWQKSSYNVLRDAIYWIRSNDNKRLDVASNIYFTWNFCLLDKLSGKIFIHKKSTFFNIILTKITLIDKRMAQTNTQSNPQANTMYSLLSF